MRSSEKRLALLTGANKGIGFEIARQLAQKDITVLIGARNQDKGIAACEQLRLEKLDAHFIPIDVMQLQSIEAAIETINDNFKRLDILIFLLDLFI